MTKKSNKLNKQIVVEPEKKKHIGRAKGTPNKITASMREMAQPYGKKALKVLRDLLKSTTEQVRLAAAKELIDRGYGKAAQVIEATGKQTIEIQVTDTELARRAAFLLAKADFETTDTDEKHTTH